MAFELLSLRSGIDVHFDDSTMLTLVELMLDNQMAYNSSAQRCPTPDPAAFGITWDLYYEYKSHGLVQNVTPLQRAGLDEFLADMESSRSFHPAGGCSIPEHKLSTNDGWIVRPFEINSALNQLDASTLYGIKEVLASMPNVRSAFARLRSFLETSELDGGFVVW